MGKADVEARHSGLSGIVAITQTHSTRDVVSKLVEAMSEGAPSRGVIPSWEDPAFRFLEGIGEVNLQTSGGPATTIFELLIHGEDRQFPFWLAGQLYSKEDLIVRVAQLLQHAPDRAKNWVREDGFKKLWKMCVKHGFNPNNF